MNNDTRQGGFTWSGPGDPAPPNNVDPGDIVQNEKLIEIRNNADYLDNNIDCMAEKAAYRTTFRTNYYDSREDAHLESYKGSLLSTRYTTLKSTHYHNRQNARYDTYKNSRQSDYLGGYFVNYHTHDYWYGGHAAQYSNQHGTNHGTHHGTYHSSYRSGNEGAYHSGYNSGRNTSYQATDHNTQYSSRETNHDAAYHLQVNSNFDDQS